ncbi:hypothetical protein [Peterkaempfera bronchialis]|uniref:Uncharacterized protein n=1 Tax=Peterkaempfera bronchialis TaxID=2126346 RepID=A0A345SU34_9ACTN|nr:hypothetical protein [Peterkaempfera bronchialis]AXI77239.1 hypothetical protein C7M71_007100 [Peterkaempfera bronchialis]
MASTPRDPRPGTPHSRGLARVTLACLVVVSVYSAVFEADPWLWFAWTALALITGAMLAMRL